MPIPKLVVTAALMAAQVAIGAMRKTEGPRLDNTHVTLADYGTPIPDIWGMKRIEGCPVFWAEELREQKKKSKGKAGKYAEYKYYGTWAVAIAAHEIEAVAKILFDNHPVFQMTGEGPIASLMSAIFNPESRTSIKISNRNIAIYLGTDTQSPDPRMEAWYEDQAEFGADCCPAHRGLAYIVFKDIPLEKFGNRIPQVTVDAVSVKTPSFLYQDVEDADTDWNQPVLSKDAARLITGDQWDFHVWDVANRAKIYQGALPGYANGTGTTNIWTPDSQGRIWSAWSQVTPFNEWYLSYWSPDGNAGPFATANIQDDDGVFYNLTHLQTLVGDGGDFILMTGDNDGFGVRTDTSLNIYIPNDLTGSAWVARFGTVDHEGQPWVAGFTGAVVTFYNIADSSYFTATLTGTPTGEFAIYHFADDAVDHFLVFTSLGLFLVEREGAHAVTGPISFTGTDIEETLRSTSPSRSTLFFSNGVSQIREYSCVDGSLIRTLSSSSWIGDLIGTDNGLYDGVNHAWLVFDATIPGLRWYYIDRIGSDGVTFGEILEEDGARVGFDVDGSALDQTVLGYSVTQGSVRDRLAPLFDIHDSILRPHDFGYQGLKRGTSSLGTILTENFVREGDEPRYVIDIAPDTELPARLDVRYADSTADHQVNTVTSVRHTGAIDSVRVQSIDLTTYVDTPDAMQQKADRFLRRQHNSKATVQNALTAKYIAVEPGDIYDLNLDGVLWTAQLEKLTHSAGAIKCEWRRTFPSLNALGFGTGPDMGGHIPEEIFVPGPVKGFFLDIPLVEDADNSTNPMIYYGAGGYGVGVMPGAAILQGDAANDDEFDEIAAVASSDMAVWGYTTDALGDANPNLWDRGNSVNIKTYGGTLSTVTEAQINADPTLNMAALRNPATGDTELLNFTTATLEADGTYTLSGFKRGRRGTEWAVGSHTAGDEFILVEDLAIENYGLSDVGDELFFKAQTYGRDPDVAPVTEIDFEAATLKPYAPARIDWYFDGTDLQGTIIRRTRVGGAWTGGSTIPLSENSEEYEVDVMDGSDVVRTITVSGTNEFTYTAAMAATDGVTLPAPPDVNVYQMSDAVGRGFALAA